MDGVEVDGAVKEWEEPLIESIHPALGLEELATGGELDGLYLHGSRRALSIAFAEVVEVTAGVVIGEILRHGFTRIPCERRASRSLFKTSDKLPGDGEFCAMTRFFAPF